MDEPAIGYGGEQMARAKDQEPGLPERIRALLESEPYGVLCTHGDQQPYGSLVAFSASPDLRVVVFATPVNTRKYHLLSRFEQVALVADSRSRFPDDMMKVEALTATGRASTIAGDSAEHQELSELLLRRHPYLKAFVHSPSTALIRISIVRYFHVARFQEVNQWVPPTDG